MDQCDSLITELMTVLLDWYSGDIHAHSFDESLSLKVDTVIKCLTKFWTLATKKHL